ncbi:diguanylate cyclase [Saccharopolyspora sp. NFXS83]|uniref:diguanylate cyclase n=1 Tax=Saccharopolyspora sp. NFXS83 TaxID=2993560 RepID=UPI00224A7314|nr:diguanylate cyclase [Saccharopolyspora sp. NFXS83]MCX2730050.1 diguanylate cyclase [Saccharopolyspora sp. NFXS83]
MISTVRRTFGGLVWPIYLVVCALVALAYFAIPENDATNPLRIVLYCAISGSAVPALLCGLRAHRPRWRLPWLLIASSQAVYFLADTSFYTAHYLLGITTFPFVADILYLAHYPLIVTGVLLLIRARSPRRDLLSLIDATVLGVAAALLSWLYLIKPLTTGDESGLTTAAYVAYPVLDLALLAVGLRLLLDPGPRPPSFFLLVGNLLAFLGADSIYVLQRIDGSYFAGNFLDALWLAGNIALGTAGLHPTMAALTQPGPGRELNLSPLRVTMLAAASLIAPGILVLENARVSNGYVNAIAAACAVLFLLTLGRLVVMVSEQRRLAVTDSLTGLHTRRYFEMELPKALARASRARTRLAVFIVDVDHFKSINDRYGHPVGDRVLVEISKRLREVVREGDVLARYGGEEFALLSTDVADEDVPAIAERLRMAVAREPVVVDRAEWIAVTTSVGAAQATGQEEDPLQVVAAADRALYAAKAEGRDRISVGERPVAVTAVDHTAALGYLHSVSDQVDHCLSSHSHGRAVGSYARVVCRAMGGDAATVHNTELAGRLHDVGKIVIPESVLGKPAALDEAEWALLRQHPDHGYHLLRSVPDLHEIAEIVRQHHERWDGKGYPLGLAAEAVRFEARIISVCDAWATMLADRPYRHTLTVDEALQELRDGRGTQFDPAVVDAFLRLHTDGEIHRLPPLLQAKS